MGFVLKSLNRFKLLVAAQGARLGDGAGPHRAFSASGVI